MSDEQPHINNGWDDLPLPDSNQSWQAMKALLDREEEKRHPLLPPFLTGCAGWGLIAGMGLLIAALLFVPGSWLSRNKTVPAVSVTNGGGTAVIPTETTTTQNGNDTTAKLSGSKQSPQVINQTQPKNTNLNTTASSIRIISQASFRKTSVLKEIDNESMSSRVQRPTASQPVSYTKGDIAASSTIAPPNTHVVKTGDNSSPVDSLAISFLSVEQPRSGGKNNTTDTSKNVATTPASDTSGSHAVTDSPIATHGRKKQHLSLSAGIGFKQQIRSSGQVAYSKGYNGKTGLGDHMPSLYLRVHGGKRWFLQGEARFDAPQLVDNFYYSRQSRYDTSAGKLNVTSLRLKKLYYHQFPLSLNYTIANHWSIGGGIVYSRFYRAVSEQQVQSQSLQGSVQSTVSTTLRISGFRDSFLYKTQMQWLLQTEYSLGRLSLGLRYKRDAQPYIRYTQPNGGVLSKKGEAVEAVLRWRLWKSKW